MKTHVVSRKLASQIAGSCLSSGCIDKWIEAVASEIGGVSWRHVGWTPSRPDVNNAGTCEVANDKRAPIAEDIFNAEDAVIELARVLRGFKDASSPHSAVATCDLFGSDEWRFGKIVATLRDSGEKARPTLDVRDFGCGQHPEGWVDTFLSLHSGTKSDKSHLCGKFGMGLKSSFKFCSRLILVSRCHEATLDGRPDEVGVTVVRKNYTKGDKTPRYEYLCGSDGEVIRLDLPSFEHGTLVRLAEYDLEGYHGGLDTPHNSLYMLLNSYLIDPPVGLTIEDRREASTKRRKFKGLLHGLANPKVANSHEDRFAVNVEFDGEESIVGVRYFVLHPKSSPHDKKGTKVKAEQGITFSHNGQRHGVESRIIFKSRFGLGAIYTRLAVVVDTSGLHPAACSDLFSSNRIGVNSDSKVYKAIMESLGAHIDGDDVLRALDEEATNRRSEDNAGITESLERAVSEIVVDILGKRRIAFKKGGPGVSKGGGGRPPRNRSDAHLPALPTRVLIDNSPLVAPQGKFAYLTLDIDAKNLYVVPGDGKVSVRFKSGKTARVSSQGELIGGKLRLTVNVPSSTPKGDSPFEVRLDDPANGVHLSAKGTLRVVAPKKGKPGKGNKTTGGDSETLGAPDVIVNWLFRDDWKDADDRWNETFPGSCTPISRDGVVTSVAFLLNADFAPITTIRERMAKRKGNAYKERIDEYGKTLCRALFYKEVQNMGLDTSFSAAMVDSVFDDVSFADDDVDSDDGPEKETHKVPAPSRSLLGNATFLAESAAIKG